MVSLLGFLFSDGIDQIPIGNNHIRRINCIMMQLATFYQLRSLQFVLVLNVLHFLLQFPLDKVDVIHDRVRFSNFVEVFVENVALELLFIKANGHTIPQALLVLVLFQADVRVK